MLNGGGGKKVETSLNLKFFSANMSPACRLPSLSCFYFIHIV